MIDAFIAILLQAAPQEAAQAGPATAQAVATTQAAVETKEPTKLVCRREFELGSRVKRIKVCRALGEPEAQQDQTTLQRALDKQGDVLPPEGGGIGN